MLLWAEETEATTSCAMHPGTDPTRGCSRPIRTRRITLFFRKLIVNDSDGLFSSGKRLETPKILYFLLETAENRPDFSFNAIVCP